MNFFFSCAFSFESLYFVYPASAKAEKSKKGGKCMYDDIAIEQRVHDLAVQATIHNYKLAGVKITERNAFEFAVMYRSLLREIRRSIEEGRSDLQ